MSASLRPCPVNLSILSSRRIWPEVGWGPVYEFENLLARLTGATIHHLAPRSRFASKLIRGPLRPRIGIHRVADPPTPKPNATNVLLIVANSPRSIAAIRTVPNWRKRFDVVAAYAIDGHDHRQFPRAARRLDHLFTMRQDDIQPLRRLTGVPTSSMLLTADVLGRGSDHPDRTIDVIGYGRQPPDYHRALQRALNTRHSRRVYYHTTFHNGPPLHFDEHRDLFWNMLRHASLAMNFGTDTYCQRDIGLSILTPRWFECFAAGCVVVGRRPTGTADADALNWPDDIIELPRQPQSAPAFILNLLEDTPRLERIRRRNYRQALARFDTRHAIAKMFDTLKLPRPAALAEELVEIDDILRTKPRRTPKKWPRTSAATFDANRHS